MSRPHKAHRWRIGSRISPTRRLMVCGYKVCSATKIRDMDKEAASAARTLRMARRVFGDMLDGVEQLKIGLDT